MSNGTQPQVLPLLQEGDSVGAPLVGAHIMLGSGVSQAMTGDSHEHEPETQPISFTSADYSAILFAPPDYRPRHVLGPVIYEDEISTLPARQGWDRDFDGGSSSTLIYLRPTATANWSESSKMTRSAADG